jgi:hypothetical protein
LRHSSIRITSFIFWQASVSIKVTQHISSTKSRKNRDAKIECSRNIITGGIVEIKNDSITIISINGRQAEITTSYRRKIYIRRTRNHWRCKRFSGILKNMILSHDINIIWSQSKQLIFRHDETINYKHIEAL